jgi:hypothetical protein
MSGGVVTDAKDTLISQETCFDANERARSKAGKN